MGAGLSLIPELEQVVQHGSHAKRVETLRRITALFLERASGFSDAHVDLFDDVFGLLIEAIGFWSGMTIGHPAGANAGRGARRHTL